MVKQLRSSLTAAAVVVVAGLSAHAIVSHDLESDLHVCQTSTQFQASIASSDVTERCLGQQTSSISWTNWLFGKSNSGQFHFLDLLELISRHSPDRKKDNRTTH